MWSYILGLLRYCRSGVHCIDIPFYIRVTKLENDRDLEVKTRDAPIELLHHYKIRAFLLSFLPPVGELGRWGEPGLVKIGRWRWFRYHILNQTPELIVVRFEFKRGLATDGLDVNEVVDFKNWIRMQNYDGFGGSQFLTLGHSYTLSFETL